MESLNRIDGSRENKLREATGVAEVEGKGEELFE